MTALAGGLRSRKVRESPSYAIISPLGGLLLHDHCQFLPVCKGLFPLSRQAACHALRNSRKGQATRFGRRSLYVDFLSEFLYPQEQGRLRVEGAGGGAARMCPFGEVLGNSVSARVNGARAS